MPGSQSVYPSDHGRLPVETVKDVTAEYARQIVAASKEDNLYTVTELLKEFGAKAYRQGREHLAAEVAKLV